jgi:hypothetical protein
MNSRRDQQLLLRLDAERFAYFILSRGQDQGRIRVDLLDIPGIELAHLRHRRSADSVHL